MTSFYLDIETTGLNPETDKIITIQFQELNRYTGEAIGELIILKEWESSEKQILEKFIEKSAIFDNYDFSFVPIGYNLGFEHKFFKKRSEINNLPCLDILSLPFLDLMAVGILMNNGQFKGSGLSNITGKKGNGNQIPIFYQNKEYNKIINYIEDETREFIKFTKWLYKKMPTLLPEFRRDMNIE